MNIVSSILKIGLELVCSGGLCSGGISLKREKFHFHLKRFPTLTSVESGGTVNAIRANLTPIPPPPPPPLNNVELGTLHRH